MLLGGQNSEKADQDMLDLAVSRFEERKKGCGAPRRGHEEITEKLGGQSSVFFLGKRGRGLKDLREGGQGVEYGLHGLLVHLGPL